MLEGKDWAMNWVIAVFLKLYAVGGVEKQNNTHEINTYFFSSLETLHSFLPQLRRLRVNPPSFQNSEQVPPLSGLRDVVVLSVDSRECRVVT